MNHIISLSIFLLILRIVHPRIGDYSSNKKNGMLIHELMNPSELLDVFGISNKAKVPEYEIFLPKRKLLPHISNSVYPDEVTFRIEAFNQTIIVLLQCNKKLINQKTKVVNKWRGYEHNLNSTIPACHYMGTVAGKKDTIVAMSTCNKVLKGTISFPDTVYHIAPVPTRLRSMLSSSYKNGTPHIIRKDDMKTYSKKNILTCGVSDECSNCPMNPDLLDINITFREIGLKDKKMKLAVFFDDVALKEFKLLGLNDDGLREFLLAFMNQVNLIFHHPTLGIKLSLTVVYLEIMNERPTDLPIHDGYVVELHKSFKKYHSQKNTPNQRWDHAVYLTGIDIWSKDQDGNRNQFVAGFADHSNMCDIGSSSIIEIGIVDPNSRSGLSGGFGAAYTVAHEIGHSLGMLHDGPEIPNTCPANGFIMTSSRGLESEWSTCSKAYLAGSLSNFKCLEDSPDNMIVDPALNLQKSQQPPGQIYDADDQCRVQAKDMTFLRYNAWNEICTNLECRRPGDVFSIYTGPALSGTFCGEGKWCQNAHCVPWGNVTLEKVTTPNWSIYISSRCFSGCLEKAKGIVTSWRYCVSPRPKNSEAFCIGDPKKISICSDDNICPQRLNLQEYINRKCTELLNSSPNIGIQANGSQRRHSFNNEETACTLFCKASSGIGSRAIGQLPEGSWCYNDGQKDYYCQNKKCRQPGK